MCLVCTLGKTSYGDKENVKQFTWYYMYLARLIGTSSLLAHWFLPLQYVLQMVLHDEPVPLSIIALHHSVIGVLASIRVTLSHTNNNISNRF